MTATMDEARVREAAPTDVPAIRQIVDEAYRRHIPRIGKPPAPMLDDYAARVSQGVVWVIEERSAIAGVIVLLPRHEHLLLDNIAELCKLSDAWYLREGRFGVDCRPSLIPS